MCSVELAGSQFREPLRMLIKQTHRAVKQDAQIFLPIIDRYLDPTEQVIPLGTRCVGDIGKIEVRNFGFCVFAGLFRRNERNTAAHEDVCWSALESWECEECTERGVGT